MNKTIKYVVLFFVAGLVAVSCENPKPEKSIENLKAAIEGETKASIKYAEFSAKASEEGYSNIAKMFAAAAEAEKIHVVNHNNVLAKLGAEKYSPETGEKPEVDITGQNIQTAIAGETYEFSVMYPGFIKEAEAEKCEDAIKTFKWAMEAEVTHSVLFQNVLDMLNLAISSETAESSDEGVKESADAGVSSEWLVCPKCGNLFDTLEGVDKCGICELEPASFKKF